MKSWFFLAALLLPLASPVNAVQMYRWVDSDGNVYYSDQVPPASATDIQQKRISTDIADDDGLTYVVREAVRNYPVTLYSSDCGELCNNAQALLAKRGVPFSEKNPVKQPADSAALKELIGTLEVPVLKVGTTVLKGFREDEWNEALDAAGYPKTSEIRPRRGRGSAPALARAGEESADPKVVSKNFPVTLYSYDCGELCDKAKALLAGRRVPFTQENAQDPAIQQKLQTLIGPDLVVPVITVGQNVVRGFDEAMWNNALDSVGYPKIIQSSEAGPGADTSK